MHPHKVGFPFPKELNRNGATGVTVQVHQPSIGNHSVREIFIILAILIVCCCCTLNSVEANVVDEVSPYYKIITLGKESEKVECVRFGPDGVYYSKPYQIVSATPQSSNFYTSGSANIGIGKKGDTNGERYKISRVSNNVVYTPSSMIDYPYKFAFHFGSGKTFFTLANHQLKVDTGNFISPFIGKPNFSGDSEGIPINGSLLNFPQGVDVSYDGNFIYVADTGNNVIKYTAYENGDLVIRRFAGTGNVTNFSDNVDALQVDLNRPVSVRYSRSSGEIFIVENGNHVIRKISMDRVATVVAGSLGRAGYQGDYQSSTSSLLNQPTDMAISASGVLYIADYGNNRVRKVYLNGTITTICGNGQNSYGDDSLNARKTSTGGVNSVDVNENGELLISHSNYIRKLIPVCYNGYVFNTETHLCNSHFQCFGKKHTDSSVCSGRGSCMNHQCQCQNGFEGAECEIVSKVYSLETLITSLSTWSLSQLTSPVIAKTMTYLQTTASSEIIASVQSNTLGEPSTIGRVTQNSYSKLANFNGRSFFISGDGSIITISGIEAIKIKADGTTSTLFRIDTTYKVDNSPYGAIMSYFNIAQDSVTGTYYVAQKDNGLLAKVDTSTNSATLIINQGGYKDGSKLDALVSSPSFIYAYDGTVLFVDGNRVRKWKAYTTSTIAGSGVTGYNGESVPKLSCSFGNIIGFYTVRKAADVYWIYVSDEYSRAIRLIKTNESNVTIIAGKPLSDRYLNFDSDPKTAVFTSPIGLSVRNEELYFIDQYSGRVMSLSNSTLKTIAGGYGTTYYGENLAPSSAFFGPSGLFMNETSGSIYVSDSKTGRIRKMMNIDGVWGNVTTLCGISNTQPPLDHGIDGDCLSCAFLRPSRMRERDGLILVTDFTNTIRLVDPTNSKVTTVAGITGTSFPFSVNISAKSYSISAAVDAVFAGDEIAFVDKARVLKINSEGKIIHLAGDGTYGSYYGNYMLATKASLASKQAPLLSLRYISSLDYFNGEYYILEDYALRKIDSKGILIPIIAGQGSKDWVSGVRKMNIKEASLPVVSFMKVIDEGEIFISSLQGQLYIIRNETIEKPIMTSSLSDVSQFYISRNKDIYFASGSDGGVISKAKYGCPTFSNLNIQSNKCEAFVKCFDILSTDKSVCSSHGSCKSNNVCSCEIGWTGANCNITSVELLIDSIVSSPITSDGGLDIRYKVSNSDLGILKQSNGIVYMLSGGKVLPINTKVNEWMSTVSTTFIAPESMNSMFISNSGTFYLTTSSCFLIRHSITTIANVVSGDCRNEGSVLGNLETARYKSISDGAVDGDDNVYIVDRDNHVVRLIYSNGTMSVFSGSFGVSGNTINTNSASKTLLKSPKAIKITANGIYISDSGNFRILLIDNSGHVQQVAGYQATISNGDGQALSTNVLPSQLDYSETRQELYFIDTNNDQKNTTSTRIRKLTAQGRIETLFGYSKNNPYSTSSLPMTISLTNQTNFYEPTSISVSGEYLWVTFNSMRLITKVSLSKNTLYVVSKIDNSFRGDGLDIKNANIKPYSIYRDKRTQKFYWVDGGDSIRTIKNGKAYTVIGKSTSIVGFGDLKPFWNSGISPTCVTTSSNGDLYFSDSAQHVVYKVPTSRSDITAVIGQKGKQGASSSLLKSPSTLFMNLKDELLIFDDNIRIIRFDIKSKKITTIAGTMKDGFSGDGGKATKAKISKVRCIIETKSGELVFTDANRIRKIDKQGIITTIAGGGSIQGPASDGTLATNTLFFGLSAIEELTTGEFIILDTYSVRKLTFSKEKNAYIVQTIAGSNVITSFDVSGDGGLAINAKFNSGGMVYDSSKNEIILAGNSLRKIYQYCPEGFSFNSTSKACEPEAICFGIKATDARVCNGRGLCIAYDTCECFGGYRGETCESVCYKTCNGTVMEPSYLVSVFASDFTEPNRITSDSSYFYVSDTKENTIKRIDLGGYSSIYAGTPDVSGNSGNGQTGTDGTLNSPLGMSFINNELFFADFNNTAIRKIDTFGFLEMAFNVTEKPLCVLALGNDVFYFADATSLFLYNQSVKTQVATGFDHPYGMFLSNSSEMIIADTMNNAIKKVSLASGEISVILTDLHSPRGVFVDSIGVMYIADSAANQILRYDGSLVTKIAGSPNGSSSENLDALDAFLNSPSDLIVTDGIIYFTDSSGFVKTLTPICDDISLYDPLSRKCFRPLLCYDYGIDDERACNSNGVCLGENTCVCNDDWVGFDCSTPNCFNISGYNTSVCSGHGDCVDVNICSCESGWFGDECQIPSCFGISAENISTCNGNGACISRDNCDCFNGWNDFDCLTPSCFGLTYDLAEVCSGNGRCVSNNTCSCYLGYEGVNCSTISINSFPSYNPTITVTSTNGFNKPKGITIYNGAVYFSDTSNHLLKKIPSSGTTVTIGGTGTASFSGDGSTATSAAISSPLGLDISGDDLYFADSGNNRIRKISNGIMTTVLQITSPQQVKIDDVNSDLWIVATNQSLSGVFKYNLNSGVLSLIYNTDLNSAYGVAITFEGKFIFITDKSNHIIRKFVKRGNGYTQSVFVGSKGATGTFSSTTRMNNPMGISITPMDNILFSDSSNHAVKLISLGKDRTLSTIVGTGSTGYSASETRPLYMALSTPGDVFADLSGIYIADTNNNAIRRIKIACPYTNYVYNHYTSKCEFDTRITCNNEPYSSPSVCSGHGSCIGTDTCQCVNGWNGTNCELPVCYGVYNSLACSSNGKCISNNTCSCNDGWFGSNCQHPSCYGISYNDTSVCSGFGQCISNNTCSCDIYHVGVNCSLPKCFGVDSRSAAVCSGRGSCSAVDQCNCYGSIGDKCETLLCFGVMSNQTNVCSNHGTCTNYNYCSCKNGYIGDNCSIPMCYGYPSNHSDVCSAHGKCVSPDTCQCDSGYNLSNNCSTYGCLGVIYSDISVCSSHGSCIGPNQCVCNEGFFGNGCDIFQCFGVISNQSNVCSGHGLCVSHNNCSCKNGYIGDNCSIPMCYGYPSNHSDVCSTHGKCVSPDTCQCDSGYNLSNNCSTYGCLGVIYSDISVCSSHGNCIGPNQCICDVNYIGINCELSTCFGILSNESNTCSSHGICIAPNNCTCSEGYFGNQCQDFDCYGLRNSNISFVCSGRGNCVSANNCSCREGYYGNDCSKFYCFGISQSNSSVCLSRGNCIKPNMCSCYDNYYGNNCEEFNCFGISFLAKNVCASHGKCVSPDTCQCEKGYTSSECSIPYCFGILSLNSSVCNGFGNCSAHDKCDCLSNSKVKYDGDQCQNHFCKATDGSFVRFTESSVCNGSGVCKLDPIMKTGVCECKENYGGEYCELHKCFGILQNESSVCNGNGYCSSVDICECYQNDAKGHWIGANCTKCKAPYSGTNCNFLKECSPSICNNHGTCDEYMSCICNSNRTHGFWQSEFCNNCQTGYFGSACSTKLVGPLTFTNDATGMTFQLIGPVSFNSSIVACARLFRVDSYQSIGYQAICTWNNGILLVEFGKNFTMTPNQTIHINRLVFDSTGSNYEPMVLGSPSAPIPPVAIFDESKRLFGSCENLIIDGRNSYSTDTKPVSFSWKVLSSPDQKVLESILTHQSGSILDIDYRNCSAGTHTFELTVSSSVLQLRSKPATISITKSEVPLPNLSIEEHPMVTTSILPYIVKKTTIMPDCALSLNLNYTWKLVKGRNDIAFEKDQFNNLLITKFSLGDNSYEFECSVFVEGHPDNMVSSSVIVSTIVYPITSSLRIVELSTNFTIIQLIFNDPEKIEENITVEWSCTDLDMNTNCSSSLIEILNKVPLNLEYLISGETFSGYSNLLLESTLIRGNRFSKSQLFINIPKKAIPPVITPIFLSPDKVQLGSYINLQFGVTIDGKDDISSLITRNWTMDGREINSSLVDTMRLSLTDSNSLILTTTNLQEGKAYKIDFKVTDQRNGQYSIFTYEFSLMVSLKCTCSVSPSSGYALQTIYTLACTNCMNSKGSLSFEYGFIDDYSRAKVTLSKSEKYMNVLPTPNEGSKLTLYALVTDTTTLSQSYSTLTTNVLVPVVSSITEARKKQAVWKTTSNSLKDGDYMKSVYSTSIMTTTFQKMTTSIQMRAECSGKGVNINGKCKCNDGYSSIDCRYSTQDFKDIQNAIVELSNEFKETFNVYLASKDSLKPKFVSTFMFGLDSLVNHFDMLNDNSFNNTLTLLSKIIHEHEKYPFIQMDTGVENLFLSVVDQLFDFSEYNDLKVQLFTDFYQLSEKISTLMTRNVVLGQKPIVLSNQMLISITNKHFREEYSGLSISYTNYSTILPENFSKQLVNQPKRTSVVYNWLALKDLSQIKLPSNTSIISSYIVKLSIENVKAVQLDDPVIFELPLSSSINVLTNNYSCVDFGVIDSPVETDCLLKLESGKATCFCRNMSITVGILQRAFSTQQVLPNNQSLWELFSLLIILVVIVAIVIVVSVVVIKKRLQKSSTLHKHISEMSLTVEMEDLA